jgi:hypothetical protein
MEYISWCSAIFSRIPDLETPANVKLYISDGDLKVLINDFLSNDYRGL